MASSLLVEAGPVTTVTLNRPDVRNALDDSLIEQLTEWANAAAADGSLRAVVLRGAGPAFCAGADLRWMRRVAGYSHEENLADARRAAALYLALDALPVPVIGRVHGPALGGGAGLVAVCDIGVAVEGATFGFPEVTVGILPAVISPYLLRKIGLSAARELCLTGERIGAARAHGIGLVHEVVPDESALDTAIERRVQAILRASPAAIAAAKRLLADVDGHRPADVAAITAEALAAQRGSPDGQEGLRAFLDRRDPRWTARRDR
jgi:methylglutaconyl-CoA hydratase